MCFPLPTHFHLGQPVVTAHYPHVAGSHCLGWCSSRIFNVEERGFFPPHRSQVCFYSIISSRSCQVVECSPPEPKSPAPRPPGPWVPADTAPPSPGQPLLGVEQQRACPLGFILQIAHPCLFPAPPGHGGEVSNVLIVIEVRGGLSVSSKSSRSWAEALSPFLECF